jgi:6-phosphogluconate dehydrogenase
MEAGKRLAKHGDDETTEIEIILKHPQPCLCPPDMHYKNKIIFRQDPKESVAIHVWAKKPGFTPDLEERVFEFDLRRSERKTQYTEEYEKLLLDCIAGDQTLFVSSEEIVAMWRFIDPVIKGWQKDVVPLRHYAPDSLAVVAEGAVLDLIDREFAGFHKKELAIYGLGKMGAGLARQLHEKGWRVVVANRSYEPVAKLEAEGLEGSGSIDEMLQKLSGPRVVWLMVTAGKPVDELLASLVGKLKKGDIVVDGGNSFFEDSARRAKLLAKKGILFLDAGVSDGACVMIGGDKKAFEKLEDLFAAISVPNGYAYFGSAGAGHFVKMVHNGIEYGMMQSIAEGFALMKKSPFKLDLEKVAALYNNGSVIESRLIGWMQSGYQAFGQELKEVSSSVAYTGEGEWTIKTGKKWKMKLPAIEDSFKFRVRSKKLPSYMGKILSALRNQFGGHSIEKKK